LLQAVPSLPFGVRTSRILRAGPGSSEFKSRLPSLVVWAGPGQDVDDMDMERVPPAIASRRFKTSEVLLYLEEALAGGTTDSVHGLVTEAEEE